MKLLLTGLFFVAVVWSSFAQSRDFILLKRGGNQKNQIRFYPGEQITYKSKKLGYFITDKIVKLETDFIYLEENILKPADILEIDIRVKDPRNRTLRNLTSLFLGSGSVLLSVEAVNGIYQGRGLNLDEGVAITSGILIGTGLALLPIRYKTFKNTSGYGVQIVLMRLD